MNRNSPHLLFVFLTSLLFFIAAPAYAQVRITEVMYDVPGTDTGREWLEVHNESGEAVDLSTWKFFEAESNHSLVPLGNSMLPAGGYAVIVHTQEKFQADWPSYSGLLFDSVFSLLNTGETLALKDPDGNLVGSFSYSSATHRRCLGECCSYTRNW